jgi:hypothetical protein
MPLISNGGPPWAGVVPVLPAGAAGGAGAAAFAGGAAAAGGAGEAASPPMEKPQPVLPFWNEAPGPEQIPDGPAQQLLPQSAPLRH